MNENNKFLIDIGSNYNSDYLYKMFNTYLGDKITRNEIFKNKNETITKNMLCNTYQIEINYKLRDLSDRDKTCDLVLCLLNIISDINGKTIS